MAATNRGHDEQTTLIQTVDREPKTVGEFFPAGSRVRACAFLISR
jgi:hypothetical protein